MDILVVGAGGREHAIIKKLGESPNVDKLYCCPGNGGIAVNATCFPVKANDITGVVELAKELNVDLVVVASDDPLVLGLVDALNDVGIKAFGPNKNAAIIEGSKAFSKELMKKYNIPTADYEVFDNYNDAISYIKSQNKFPIVIKADGLALGKGVVIAENIIDAEQAINSMMVEKVFGGSGDKIVIEEFISGPEVSVLAFTDSKCIIPMVSAMDHKRAYNNNEGPNTGGMGTVAPNPHYTENLANECMEKIFIPTIKAMNKEGRPFKGCLFFGLMLTKDGPKVIEYNCRFGDPETQVVLPLLKSDLAEIFISVIDETLEKFEVSWSDDTAACVIMSSGGYPKDYETGKVINGLDNNGQIDEAIIYHAGTKLENGVFKTSGGRVIGITATDKTLENALSKAYKIVNNISFDNAHFRTDIGKIY